MFTHYTLDDCSERAYCGHRMREADQHSPFPTCRACADALAAELAIDEAVDAMPWPLDADGAADLDPVLNAGVPAPAPISPFGASLVALAVALNRTYVAQLPRRGRR